jgi:CTP:molybdopterin cytidylyltransferase MocA
MCAMTGPPMLDEPPSGLVLAAGAGRRFGGPKAPVVIAGERLIDHAVRVLRQGGCHPIFAVLGAWVGTVEGATVLVNEQWPSGMGSSLQVGLTELEMSEADRVVVTLVDLPGLTAAAVARLLATPKRLAAATYHGRRGHPVLLGREHWRGICTSASGDRGAREYLYAHRAELELVEMEDVADGTDLDA